MEAEPVTVTVSGGLGVREMWREMPCSHVTSLRVCLWLMQGMGQMTKTYTWCSHLTSTFAPNVKNGLRTHSPYMFASPLIQC